MTEAQVERVCEELASPWPAVERNRADVSLPQRPRPSLLAAQPLDRVRLAAGALRHRPVAGARPRPAARSACSTTRSCAQIDAGLERVRAQMGEHGFEFDDADEDIHMAIERLLGEEIGPLAGKLHTGRSRNDQVATDVAMVVQAHSLRAIELSGAAMERLLEPRRAPPRLADARLHPPAARPAGLPRPPPARLLLDARPRRPALPVRARQRLGDAARLRRSGRASTGRSTARAVADDLGFAHVSPNSIDGASNRDFVLDYLAAASACAMHLSRLGSEIVIWSSSEFGFCRARRVLLLGVEHHAAEGEPRLGRAAARQEPARRRRLRRADRHDARPAAHLRQGHAGGQGAALRRDRHGRALPRRDRGDARPGSSSTASGWRRPRATRCWRRPRSPTCWSARACRSARRTGSSAASSATRSSRASSLSELRPEELRERSEHLDDSYYEVLRARQLARVEADRGRNRLRGARQRRSSWPARPSRRSRRGCSKSDLETWRQRARSGSASTSSTARSTRSPAS